MENLIKSYQTEIKDTNENDRTITHYISTKNVDSYNEILIPKGMDDSKFKAVLWSHERDTFSFFGANAKPSNLIVGKSLWRTPDDYGVLAKTQFAQTPLGEDIYQFNKQGFLNSWSVGWMPKGNVEVLDNGTKQFNEWYLYEYSSVIFPANSESVNVNNENVELMIKSAKSDEVKDFFEMKSFKDSIMNISKLHIDNEKKFEDLELSLKAFNENITNSINEIKESLKAKSDIVEIVGNKRLSQSELNTLVKSGVSGAISSITGKKIKL